MSGRLGKEGTVVAETTTGPLAWVLKRNGGREPFDADKICHALFMASEALGLPNAFLARELTDAVVHFLAADTTDTTTTTTQIAEQVVKVVRELGQPALAQAFAQNAGRHQADPPWSAPTPRTASLTFSWDDSPQNVTLRCMQLYSEHAVFSRDLVSAHAAGLLRIAGLATPRTLAGCVCDIATPEGLRDLVSLCDAAGQSLVLDGPEWCFAGFSASLVDDFFLPWCATFPAMVRRQLVVNLNANQPPVWARQRGAGPLFNDEAIPNQATLEPVLDAVVEHLPAIAPWIRWDWHLQARDFAGGPYRDRLQRIARRALDGAPVAFVFDRPRRPIALAEGMDRQRRALLMEIGVDLAAFLRLPEVAGNADTFRDKLPSLARMVVSAAVQKRRYLRRHADGTALARGFLLDRAGLSLVPLGLDSVVHSLTGQSAVASPLSLDLARQILQLLRAHLQSAAKASSLDARIDGPGPGLLALRGDEPSPTAGFHPVESETSSERLLGAAGALHAVAGHGTTRICLPIEGARSAPELVDLLQFAWRKTEVVRVALADRPSDH